MTVLRAESLERFWSNVVFPTDPGSCWIWKGCRHIRGYGTYGQAKAHRISYWSVYGEIPSNLEIDHLCSVKSCVNPMHLEAVTHTVNVKRGLGGELAAIRNKNKTHCPKGHLYSGENLYTNGAGHRYCKKCHADRERIRRSKGAK